MRDFVQQYQDKVYNEGLRTDLQRLADAARAAAKNHDVQQAEEMYHILHDLDYWLLNYRPDLEENAHVHDKSMILEYYGELS